jgi:hypothetical protein
MQEFAAMSGAAFEAWRRFSQKAGFSPPLCGDSE